MNKLVTLFDPQGQSVDVPQERVVPLMRSGFSAKRGQKITLGDEKHTEIPIERLAASLSEDNIDPFIESSEGRFKREAGQQYGGLSGLAKGVGYGALQGATLGLGGKGLMAAGLASPEDLAKLQEAQGGAIFGGELAGGLGLAALTGGGSAVAEGAGVAAAKTLGRRVAESAGREALIGAGYGAGSELTQAGIENREANLGQAAATGAGVGGTLGAIAPAFGAAAGRATERKAAAEADALAAKAAGGTPTGDAAAQLSGKAAEIRTLAENKAAMAQSLLEEHDAIREAVHSLAPGAVAKAGGNLGGAIESAIGNVNKAMDRTLGAITKSGDAFSMIDKTDDFVNALSQANVDALSARTTLASQRVELTGLYNKSLEELQLAREAGRNESVLQGLQNRVDVINANLGNLKKMDDLLSKVGTLQHEGATLGQEAATNYAAQGLGKKDIARTMRKLNSLGESSLEVAGSEAGAARSSAEDLVNRVQQSSLGPNDGAAIPTSTAAKSEPFAQRLIEVAGDTEKVKGVIRDLAAADIAHGGSGSLFKAAIGREGVRDALFANPEATAYANQFAKFGVENGFLKRAGGKRVKSAVGGLEGAAGGLAPDVRSGIEAQALEDAQQFYPNAKANHSIGLEAQARYNAMLPPAKELTEAAVQKTAPVAAKTIVAASPEETAALRTTLDAQEKALSDLEQTGKELAEKRIKNNAEISSLDSQIAAEKKANVRKALETKRDALVAQKTAYEQASAKNASARQTLAQDAADLRMNRVFSGEAAAQGAENLAMAKSLKQQAERTLKASALEMDIERGTSKLSGQRQLVSGLEALRDRERQFAEVLESFEAAGGGTAIGKSKLRSGPFALDAEGTFQKDWATFLNTAEGRAMRKAMDAQSKAAAKIFGDPNKVMGALGAVEIMHGVFGGGWIPTLIGGVLAAKSGKAGMAKAASTVLNPVAFWGGVGKVMDMMERGSLPAGRAMAVNKGYTFSVPAANAYVDGILKDRQAANETFDKLARTGGINPAEIQNARQRFNAAVDYLERKRPATSNGADAQAFARSVAVLRNPDLLAKFVHDGSLRQQDVDVLQLVSPEAYDQLKVAVQLLQEKKPEMAMNLAPLFKLMSKTKMSMRSGGGGLSLGMAQMLIGSAPSSQGPMVPGAETAAARARPGKESSLVENTKL